MPILLTTPFNPGDLDPGKIYPFVQITALEFKFKESYVGIVLERGYLDGDNFVYSEVTPPMQFLIKDNPFLDPPTTDFTDLVVTVGVVDVLVYDQVGIGLYQWLLDREYFEGTIV